MKISIFVKVIVTMISRMLTRIRGIYKMSKLSLSAFIIVIVMFIAPNIAKASPPTPISSLAGWNAEYWDNADQSGAPALSRIDGAINFNWGNNAPTTDLPTDNFSVRWLNTISVPAGRYRFTLYADDGVRIFINHKLVLDRWNSQGYQVHSAFADLEGGGDLVRIDYVDRSGSARIQLKAQRITLAAAAAPQRELRTAVRSNNRPWDVAFFNNTELKGDPIHTQQSVSANFDWSKSKPKSVLSSNFSVRLTKREYLNAGNYRFIIAADDGVRVYVDGKLVINDWQPARQRITRSNTLAIEAGFHDIVVEYFNQGNTSQLNVTWELA